MIFENKNFTSLLFKNLNYVEYIKEHNISSLLNINLDDYGDPTKKKLQKLSDSFDPEIDAEFEAELDDLCRLHWLVNSRCVTTILEFGLGKSTVIFNDALIKIKNLHEKYIRNNLRRNNLFECHSIENYEKWIEKFKKNHVLNACKIHKANLKMGTFADRICTYYDPLPNICPDLIYLDGPDQFSPDGDVRGISTRHMDRLPMAADILTIEHFLLPGTLIIVDGRTANARFLKANLQRDWIYCHDVSADQHFFELSEIPLGVYNKLQIEYCLGKSYFLRLNKLNQ